MLKQWVEDRLRRAGWSANAEWSAPGKLGQRYVLRCGKFEVRIEEEVIPAFLEGFEYGKWQAELEKSKE